MKVTLRSLMVGVILATCDAAHAGEDSAGTVLLPMVNPRGDALTAIERDRDSVIIEQSEKVPEEEGTEYRLYLDRLENHELIDLMVGDEKLETNGFETLGDFKDLVYSALDAPCRILDTRSYQNPFVIMGSPQDILPPPISPPISSPITGGKAREVFDYGIGWQGGDETCAADLAGKDALVVSLTAISPIFPTKFPGSGYGTLLNGAEMGETGWNKTASLTIGSMITPREWYQYEFSPAPYKKAVTVTWDANMSLISGLAIVTRQSDKPDVVLYSRGDAHYTIDVVGYLDDPERCPLFTTLIDGLCWGMFEFGPADWYSANQDCSEAGGRLPSAGALSGAIKAGKITPSTNHFADGWFFADTIYYKQQITSTGQAALTTADAKYRCVWTPLIVP